MNVTCPECSTVYRVDPAKVPAGGVRARCAVCQAVFPVSAEPATVGAAAPVRTPEPAPAAAAPAPRSTPTAAPSPAPAPATAPAPSATPARPSPFVPPAVSRPAAAMPPSAPPARPAPSAPARPAPRAGGAPVNPFLSQDPRQKARRLARALVSDIAVYNPEKRREALRGGRLKEAFAEEIKKSWEEYTGQVGREIADSTPFFTEALNEILAEGQQVF